MVFVSVLRHKGYSQETIANSDSSSSQTDSSQVVQTDSLNTTPLKNVSAWTINSSETSEIIVEDIVDFARLLPDVASLDYGSLAQSSPFAFRGATVQESRVMFNGLIMEEPINGFLNTATLPINIVEEFRFAGSDLYSLYGYQALGGTLNIDTKRIQGSRPYSRVQFRAGDWGYSDIGITFGLPVSKSSHLMISGSRQELDGFLQERRDIVDSRFFGKFSYRPNKNFDLNFISLLNKSDLQVPAPVLPDLVPQLSDPRRKEARFDQQIAVKLGNLSERNKQLQAQLFFSRIRQESFADSLLFDNKNITIGGALQQEVIAGNHWFAFGAAIRTYDLDSAQLGDRNERFGHVFIRDNYRFLSKFAIGLQVRFEKYEGYSSKFNPSALLNYEAAENSKFWLAVRRANRYATFAERFWPTQFYRGNPALEVEKGTSFEFGLNLQNDRNLEFQSAFFANKVSDWIGNTLSADTLSFGPQNLNDRTIVGLDFKLIWDFHSGGQFGLIGSYLQVDEDESEKQLQVPEYSLYSYVEYGNHLFENFIYIKLRVDARVFGERSGLIYENGAAFPRYVTRSPDAVLDGMISLIFSDARLNISYENILDKRYQLVPGFSMPPRTLRFGVDWQFWD